MSNRKISAVIMNSPFILADCKQKPTALKPQTWQTSVQAQGLPHLSDCVPRRHEERTNGIPQEIRKSPLPSNKAAYDTGDNRVESENVSSESALEQLAHRDLTMERHGSGKTLGHRHPTIDDPLGRKIDQLYHHGEDLYHSKHILEHLAAGSWRQQGNQNAEHEDQFSAPRDAKSESGNPPSPRLHSIALDDMGRVVEPADTHKLEADPLLFAEQDQSPRLHSVSMDEYGEENQLHRHSLLDDPIDMEELSPRSPRIGQSLLSLVENYSSQDKSQEQNGSRRTNKQQETGRNGSEWSSRRLKPASPRGWLDRPVKAPRVAEENRGQPLPTSIKAADRDPSSNADCKIYQQWQEDGQKAGAHDLAPTTESWPRLRRVDKTILENPQHSDHTTVAPWAQPSLRKVSLEEQTHHFHPPEPESTQWREHLRKVENAESRRPIARQPSPPGQYREHIRARNSTPSPASAKVDCNHCNPSKATSPSMRSQQATPCLVVEDDQTGYTEHIILSPDNVNHGHSASQLKSLRPAPTASRLRLRDLEHCLATQSEEDLLHSQAQRQSSAHATQQSQAVNRESSIVHEDIELERLHQPKPVVPVDHVCEWRAKCMDLNSEVEQLRSEVSSRDAGFDVSELRPPRRIDVGVGEALARHDCDEFGIEGLTIVLHMRGKDDLVINTDLEKESSYDHE